MSKLDELIQKYCPNGVEKVELGKVCDISKGIQFNKSEMSNLGTYPVVNGGINPSGYTETFNEQENTITISQGGASAGYVNFLTCKFWLGAHCYAVKPGSMIINRYLYHFVKQNENILQQCQYGAGIPALAKSTISSLLIPLPPLPVQEEIVRILDAMTDLQENLEKELEERRKQYVFYRDKLLSFNELTAPPSWRVEWKQLVDVANVLYGCPFDAKLFTDEDSFVPLIRIRDVLSGTPSTYYKGTYEQKYIIHEGDILVGMDGNFNLGRWKGRDGILCQRTCKIEENGKQQVLNNYLYHLLGPIFKRIEDSTQGGSVKHLSVSTINKISIPLPPLSIQQEIVEKLDKMEELVSNIENELTERKKQYEYYRDKLLTFE